MNERIKELIAQAGFFPTELTQVGPSVEKFAELIVKECAELIESQHTWITSVAASALIRKHFRIK
jgi:hypothetical protein